MADAGTGNFGQYLIRGLTGRITSAMATELRNWSEVDLRTRQVGNQAVKLNSRDYTSTSGEQNAVQSKPNMTVATQGVTAFEASPRFASGIAGGKLVGFKSNPDMKGSSAGTVSIVRGFECKFDGGTGRTVTNQMFVLDCMTSNAATVTGGCYVIGITAAGGGGTGWTGFLRASASGAGGVVVSSDGMQNDPSTDTEAGYISIYVGSTRYEVPFYAIT